MLRPVFAVGSAAFHEHGLHHIVPVAGIRVEVFEFIGEGPFGPEMVVRIDDLAARIDHVLADLIQPLRIVEHAVFLPNPA
jgi:hypothetical protein